jgi:hypothetical protein
MQNPDYNSGSIIFSEGKWFPFRIHNLVQLQDDAWYYVLQDMNGLKHFMPAANYESYGFNSGDEITCKVDRINCTGRIFLEPRHPCYNEGEIYYFDVISYSNPGQEIELIIKDFLGNCIEVDINSVRKVDINEEKMVRCIVKNIKKGRLILEIHPETT